MSYIVLSPVGDGRSHVLDEFVEACMNLVPPPDEIVLCFNRETELPIDKYTSLCHILFSDAPFRAHSLDRIADAREMLRKYAIAHENNYQEALWIDSDIIVPPDLFVALHDAREKENALVVVNKYQGRGDRKWCGSGVMLTHRVALTSSHFWVGRIWQGESREKRLSEDLLFFAIIDQGKHFYRMWDAPSGRICKEYVEVVHHI